MISMFPGVGVGVGGMTVNVVGACCGGSGVVVCGNGGVGGVLVRGVFCMLPALLDAVPMMNAIMTLFLLFRRARPLFLTLSLPHWAA